jgi:hypothetical protein
LEEFQSSDEKGRKATEAWFHVFFWVGRMVGTGDTIPARVVPELGLYYRIYGYLRIFE